MNNQAYRCYNHAYELGKRIPEFEEIIATNADSSYYYAQDIIKGKFALGERIIATDAFYSYWYAKNIIKGRFLLGEKKILESLFVDLYKQLIKQGNKK